MAKRIPRIIVEAYDKTWKFDARKKCGYVICDRLKKVMSISKKCNPYETKDGFKCFLCGCGNYTCDDIWYHKVYYKGKEIRYGYD